MNLAVAMQWAVILACLSIVILVACAVPILLQWRRQLGVVEAATEKLNAHLQELVHDGRELVRNMNELSQRTGRQLEDVGQVVGSVLHWTKRADRIVLEAANAIEPPVLSAARNVNLLATGVTTFFEVLANSRRHRNPSRRRGNNHE